MGNRVREPSFSVLIPNAHLCSRLQVNDLSPSLLAFLLLPRILETAKQYNTTPRIVVVASEVHYWTKLEDKVLASPNAFEVLGSKEYCTTKWADRICTTEPES